MPVTVCEEVPQTVGEALTHTTFVTAMTIVVVVVVVLVGSVAVHAKGTLNLSSHP
jgi:hypothetical protein